MGDFVETADKYDPIDGAQTTVNYHFTREYELLNDPDMAPVCAAKETFEGVYGCGARGGCYCSHMVASGRPSRLECGLSTS